MAFLSSFLDMVRTIGLNDVIDMAIMAFVIYKVLYFLARTGSGKGQIRDFITQTFGYDLSRTCEQIRPAYYHVETCQKTVPEAVTAFLEGTDFEDVIRTAVSLGGDCDTLTCIAGSIAEAFYGVPAELKSECLKRLPEDMRPVLERFDRLRGEGRRDGE